MEPVVDSLRVHQLNVADTTRATTLAAEKRLIGLQGDRSLMTAFFRGFALNGRRPQIRRAAGIRVVHPRFGIMLAGEGGMLAKIAPLFRLGLGGRIADGRQYMSWIASDDLLGVLLEAVMNDELRGPVNAVAPESISNATFTKALASAVHRSAIVPVPKLAIKAAFGELAQELLLVSQRAEPARLTEAGFSFAYPAIDETLRHELGARSADATPRVPEPGATIARAGVS